MFFSHSVFNATGMLGNLPRQTTFLEFSFFFAYEYFAFSLESMSVLLNTDICVMLLGCLGILWAQNKPPIWTERIFISIGIFASYFSMFNMPMITIGFPLVLWLSLSENKVSPEATRIKKLCYIPPVG